MKYIYVASKYQNKEAVRLAMRTLRSRGYGITHDWTHEDETAIPAQLRDEYLSTGAEEDLNGVRKADAVLILALPAMRGAYVEMGAALALDKFVIIVGEDTCIFSRLCETVPTLDDAITLLGRRI